MREGGPSMMGRVPDPWRARPPKRSWWRGRKRYFVAVIVAVVAGLEYLGIGVSGPVMELLAELGLTEL